MPKYAVVTGAGSGFGFEMVRLLLKEGWHVMATLKSDAEKSAFSPHEPLYEHLRWVVMDLTDAVQIQNTVEQIAEVYPQLDLLINNAGFGTYGALEDLSEDQLRLQMEVNFFGPVFFTRLLLSQLRRAQGRIITITSIMAQYSMPLVEAYSASKYALEGLFEGLYYEMKPQGVQVCTVQPGGYRTAFFKALHWGDTSFDKDSPYFTWGQNFQAFMDRLGQRSQAPHPQEVAQKMHWLLQQKRMPRSVVVGKDAVLIATLRKLLPAVVFHFLIQRMNQRVMKF